MFLNCLIGGARPGFAENQLCAATLQGHLEAEHAQRFPQEDGEADRGFPSRTLHIQKIANTRGTSGLHVTLHHWADLALELWGDLIDASDAFHISLMIIAKDAYSLSGIRNVGLHRYYDSIPTWSRFWQVFLEPHPLPGVRRSPYQTLAGQDRGAIGIIDDVSPVGRAFRSWRVWPTNAIPYLRGWDEAIGPLPTAVLEDWAAINLLAYQLGLLKPKILLVLGRKAGQTDQVVKRALNLCPCDVPAVFYVPHPGGRHFFQEGPAILAALREVLPDPG